MESSQIITAAAFLVLLIYVIWRDRKAPKPETALAELMGRLAQMADNQTSMQTRLAEQLQTQERNLGETLNARLTDITLKVNTTLEKGTASTNQTITDIREKLTIINQAQKNITDLSTQVVGLQDILSNKQSRGTFGEVQLQDLVKDLLPPNVYDFQATLSNGKRVDCLIKLPGPPGIITIDAKFPLEDYRALLNAENEQQKKDAARNFTIAVTKHINDIADKYIIPGETAEQALMFLPSESVYSEIHINFPDLMKKSRDRRVWIVSPTNLMMTLTTVRAILRDAQMQEQASLIQKEIGILLEDVNRLDDRVGKLNTHFAQAQKDIGDIQTSTRKITSRGEKIQDVQLESDDQKSNITPLPTPQKKAG